MLNYLTKDYCEFINNIKIAQKNQDEQQVEKVLDVTKVNNVVTSKEIWPSAPSQIFLSTNYDNYSEAKTPPDLAYTIPIINTASPKYTPLKLTVTPYPAMSAWKLECSSNMTLPSSISKVFYGEQTVIVPLTPSSTEELRWIQAVPACDGYPMDPPRFRFFMAAGDGAEPAVTPGEPETGGDDEQTTDADYHWTFNNTSAPLTDIAKGISLESYRNPSPVSSHLDTSEPIDGNALKGVVYTTDGASWLRVGNASYKRYDTADGLSRYAWRNETTNTVVFTESDAPAAGDTVYDESDNALTDTVIEKYTQNGNYFHAEWPAPANTTGPITISFCVLPQWGGTLNFGGATFTIAYGNSLTCTWNGGDRWVGTSGLNTPGVSVWNGGIQRMRSDGWCHVALVWLGWINGDMLYTSERGYGLECMFTVMVNKNGAHYGYVRDPSKDTDSRYAWTYTSSVTTSTQATDIPTVWTDSEELVVGTAITGYDAAEGGNTVSLNYGITKYRFRHDTVPPIPDNAAYAEVPYIEAWTNYNKTTYPSAGFLAYVYHNGTLRGYTKPDRGRSRPGNYLTITMNPTSAKPQGIEVDDIRIYYRALSSTEIATLASYVGTVVVSSSSSSDDIGIGGGTHIIRSAKATLYKITVNSTTYYYDPDYTVFKPTTADKKASHFGWTKLSGSGPDHIWTDSMAPEQNTKCYADPDDESVDDNLVISNRAELNYDDIPLKSHMTSYVIDERTVAVICDTHDFIQNRMRAFFPDLEAIHYLNRKGYYNGGNDYKGAGSVNCSVIDTDKIYQPMYRNAMDDESNFQVDGQPVTLYARWWECIGLFHMTPFQFRNCKPGDIWYVPPTGKNFRVMSYWHGIGDYAHVAYLRLSTPMTEGSTHTITWLSNSCTVKYSREQYSAAIKVNQEGYRAWAGKRYAYLGRWLASAEAWDPLEVVNSDRKFYVTPADAEDPIAEAIYSGTMVQRCAYNTLAANGLCSDRVKDPGKPLDGENTYELEFSNITSCKKDRITIPSSANDNGKRFRDKTEDWVDGTITVDSTVYTRDPGHDACCAWAWYNSGATPSRIYTDTSFPTTSDKARIGYDDSTTEYTITAVVQTPRYGWAPERVTQADYAKTNIVWTTSQTPASGDTAMYRDRTTTTVSSYAAQQTTADISGDYQIYIPHVGWSHVFNLGNQGVGHMFYIYSRGMYHQRSGCPNVHRPWTNFEYGWAAHAPIFDGQAIRDPKEAANTEVTWKVDPETHDPILSSGAKTPLSTSGSMFGECGELESYTKHYPLYGVHGGWFDAADFDMRDEHLDCVSALAVAYIYFPQNFEDGQLQIPESGDGVPDILSESIWGAELYRRAQFADGGIGAWFETSSHEKDWPWLSSKRYYRCAGDYFGSLWYITSAARLAYALRMAGDRAETAGNAAGAKRCRRYAELYTESALRAWDFVEREFESPWVVKPDDQRTRRFVTFKDETFEYLQPITVMDSEDRLSTTGVHLLEAVASMFRLTRQERFRPWITVHKVNALYPKLLADENRWTEYIPWELVKGIEDDFPEASEIARDFVVYQADRWIGWQEKNTYRLIFWEPNKSSWYTSQGYGLFQPDYRGLLCVAAYLSTDDTYYLDRLALAMDHTNGCNGIGRTHTTGLGKVYPVRHLDSWLPRASGQGNMWTARPGISLFTMPGANFPAEAFNVGIGPSIKARGDMNFAATSFDLFPIVLASKYNASAGTLKANVITPKVPMWRLHQCFETEDICAGTSEYAVRANMVWKAVISGMLMGPGWKPKFWYNQVKPASKQHEEPNYVVLP